MQGHIKAHCPVRHKRIPKCRHDLAELAHEDKTSQTETQPWVVGGLNAVRIVGTFPQEECHLRGARRPNYCDVEP